jgi:hypothetical protein
MNVYVTQNSPFPLTKLLMFIRLRLMLMLMLMLRPGRFW